MRFSPDFITTRAHRRVYKIDMNDHGDLQIYTYEKVFDYDNNTKVTKSCKSIIDHPLVENVGKHKRLHLKDFRITNYKDEKIVFTGGQFSEKNDAPNTFALLLKSGEWETLPPLNHGRINHSVTTSGNMIFVACGSSINSTQTQYLTSIESLNMDDPISWTLMDIKEKILTPRQQFIFSPISQSELLVLGGWSDTKIDSGIIFNWKTQKSIQIKDEFMNEHLAQCPAEMIQPGVVMALVIDFTSNLRLVKFERSKMQFTIVEDFGETD